jgi:endoglucanase
VKIGFNMRYILRILLVLFLFSCQSIEPKHKESVNKNIRLNQIGYHPKSNKQFILADTTATQFQLLNYQQETVYTGRVKSNGNWGPSGEAVYMGDFSSFEVPGTYQIIVNERTSYPFDIKANLYQEAWHASIKSYYFQRASLPIEKKFDSLFYRAAGHPDMRCFYHPSSGKTSGFLASPGGWYDAGDYGKYVVNGALSTGQMLLLYALYPQAVADQTLHIPESGNGVNDLLDELKYELDWLLTMQDEDGGVFHKLTAKNFSGFISPEAYDLDRYVIGKGTAASLDFAAVIAQSARLLAPTHELWSQMALGAAEKAWKWAQLNPQRAFSNPDDVKTGEYGDTQFDDDFYWAAAELYLATQEAMYLNYLQSNKETYQHQPTNSWKFFTRNVAFASLLIHQDLIDPKLYETLKKEHLLLSDSLLEVINHHPYRIALNTFEWGSNSDILNQALLLCLAHQLTAEEKYLIGAEQITDYVFGKNATGYSFLTGFGSKRVRFPHHRPSGADRILKPIPGFIVGGPNGDRQDQQEVTYTSALPAKAYQDVQPSYASNEVCLNWNAPAVFVLGYILQVRN